VFNQTGFNETPFNRPNTLDIFFSVSMHGEGSLTGMPSVTYSASVEMHGEASLSADFIREIVAQASMHGEGTMSAEYIREIMSSAAMHGDGYFSAIPKKFHVDSITVEGPFAPGDKFVIDSSKFRITKNGEIVGYEGELFDINPGVNTITYTDDATGRNVLIRISHRDRYLY